MDREASEKEREKELPTLKDNDFVNEQMKVSKTAAFERMPSSGTCDVLGLYRGGGEAEIDGDPDGRRGLFDEVALDGLQPAVR